MSEYSEDRSLQLLGSSWLFAALAMIIHTVGWGLGYWNMTHWTYWAATAFLVLNSVLSTIHYVRHEVMASG